MVSLVGFAAPLRCRVTMMHNYAPERAGLKPEIAPALPQIMFGKHGSDIYFCGGSSGDRHLQSGALIMPLDDAHLRTRSGYYLLRLVGARAHAESEVVADWLLRESAQRERYGQTT